MLIGHHTETAGAGSREHGGDLTAAWRMFPDAPEPFIDLSTGINPFPYPIPTLSADEFVRLPDRARIRRLAAAAAQWYGAPSADGVVPAPGTQILLPMVAALVPPGRAAVLGPTYSEHVHAAKLVGHETTEVSSIDQLGRAKLAVVVNPNNPDGRIVSRAALLDVAAELRRRSGLLIVDEAFADIAQPGVSLAGDVDHDGIIVLRSFGKFFGLAGVRLGFALTSAALARRLDATLGPWAISGAAIAIAEKAMADRAWKEQTLRSLRQAAERLDGVLAGAGLDLLGGTLLYRLTRSPRANALFEKLGHSGILVRRFREHPTWLRWGMPATEMAWQRIEAVFSSTDESAPRPSQQLSQIGS
jgi:cobalamin biosynthetic protein CobC